MIFRYYIIGGDGKSYEQQVEVQDRPGRSYLQLEADAQRLINNELAESGATQLTLPDTSRGLDRYVPEVQRNFDQRTGTTNVGGRTINLSNPNMPTVTQGGTSPLLPPGTNLPPVVAPTMQMASSEGANGQTFYGDVDTGYGVATPGMAGSRGTITNPFDYNPEFSAPGSIDTRTPVREFEGDVIESGGPLFKPEVDEKVGDFDIPPPPGGGLSAEQAAERAAEREFYDSANYRREGYPGEARLLREIEKDGTIYREYEFNLTGDRGNTAYKGFFIVAPGADNIYENSFNYEYPITNEAFEKGVNWGEININDFAFLTEPKDSDLIQSQIFDNFKFKATRGPLPSIFKDLGRDYQLEPSKLSLGNFAQYHGTEKIQFDVGNEVEKKAEDIDAVLAGEGFRSGDGKPQTITTADGTRIDTDGITSVKSAPTYKGATLENFFKEIGLNIPKDQAGNDIPIDRFTALPGFPTDLLDPQNLYIEVQTTSTGPDPADPTGVKQITTTSTNFLPNPAIQAAVDLYASRLGSQTNLQASADDILQAQISATGGKAGPADGLRPDELADLERELQIISSTGGRLASVSRGEGDARELTQELTPLGRQELTQEALRASGGLLGGFYSPLDAEGNPLEPGQQRFVQGFTPQQLLQRQQQQELDRIQAQNIPSVLQAQLEAQQLGQQQSQAEAQRRAGILGQLSDIYSNPAQLAAIVRSGGNPLAQLQNELNRALPTSGTGSLNIPEGLLNMPTAPTTFGTSGVPQTPVSPATTTTTGLDTNNNQTNIELAQAQRDIESTAQVNDPNTGQSIRIRASSLPGTPPQVVNDQGFVVPVEGAFYTIENVATGATEERFIPNTEIRNYGFSDPFIFNKIASNPNYAGPNKEFFGIDEQQITTAVEEARPTTVAPTPEPTTLPRFTAPDVPFYNPQMTEADIPLTNYGQQGIFGAAAVQGIAPDEVALRASGFTPGGTSPLKGYFGGNPLGERLGIL
tara:strand:+ start:1758 stop:4700 length:2943 start_codon:yes stop_codon:yes gene_type:complete